MVKKIYLEKAVSKKSGNEYLAVVFDCDWSVQRVFADKLAICSLFDLSVQELSELKVGETIPLPFKGDK